MDRIRVLVVDDSTVIRRVLTTALSEDPSIEVVGVAADGKIALAKISQLNPDLVTLDVEMPVMDGLETLTEIRRLYPQLPVIMFSTLTERGAKTTLDALARGANDYATKPSNTGSVAESIKSVKEELIPKIQLFCKRLCPETLRPIAVVGGRATNNSQNAFARSNTISSSNATTQNTRQTSGPVDAVVIGTSTGGPNALTQVIPALAKDLPVPVFIVQHMPPVFTARLAERLDQLSAIRVVEAVDGMRVEPGTAYLAPGDYHLKLVRRGTEVQVKLTQEAPECSCRPAVDVLFRSAVELYGPSLLAVVLTGMGQDGMRGSDLIRANGGYVMAQDEQTSVVWGMPGAVTRAGLANEILPLETVAASIEQQLRRGRRATSSLQLVGATI